MDDVFTPYERGLRALGQILGDRHPERQTLLNYEHRLRVNIQKARDHGDTPTLSAERNQIADQLNGLALETAETSFNQLCGLERREPVLAMPLVKLSPWAMVFFNLVVVAIGVLVFRPWLATCLPCLSSLVSALSLTIILLVLLHLGWRIFHPIVKAFGGTVQVAVVAVPIQVFASLLDALHPWPLSDSLVWMLAIGISLVVAVVGLSPLSPFPSPREELPIIQNFSVQFLERAETTMTFSPGDVVELEFNEQVRVQVETLGEGVCHCDWSTPDGPLHSTGGCSVLYSAPFYETYDSLTVQARSPCKTQSAYASLNIKIVSTD